MSVSAIDAITVTGSAASAQAIAALSPFSTETRLARDAANRAVTLDRDPSATIRNEPQIPASQPAIYAQAYAAAAAAYVRVAVIAPSEPRAPAIVAVAPVARIEVPLVATGSLFDRRA